MAPKRTSITFAASAVGDLEEILDWYSDQHAPEAGKKLVGEVLRSVEKLPEFPDSGRMVPEFGVAYLREIILPPFRIVYRQIRVVRIWRSERVLRLPE